MSLMLNGQWKAMGMMGKLLSTGKSNVHLCMYFHTGFHLTPDCFKNCYLASTCSALELYNSVYFDGGRKPQGKNKFGEAYI